jgi:preprotein translocase subunit SecF
MISIASKEIEFSRLYKRLNILSLILVIISLGMLSIKGLNLGVDFKGGT